jgi:tripartite-type tricarboxylate transporter receptor subunit TctC
MIRRARWIVLLTLVSAVGTVACGPDSGSDRFRVADGARVRHIMPWPAGSGSDIAMRGFLAYVEKHLGARIFTENISGGLSARGMLHTRSAVPDGTTIGTMTYDILTIEFFDLVPVSWRDFDILATVTEHPSALIARADRWADLTEFREDAGRHRLKIGNVGSGSVFHQHAAGMEKELGAGFIHVPYTSSGGQLGALLGGEVDAIVTGLPAVLPHVRQGTLRVLAVMARERNPLLPDAPTFVEAGFNVVFSSFRMLVLPKGVDEATRVRLESAIREAWNDPDFQAWADRAGLGATWKDADESRAFIQELSPRVMEILEEMTR